MRAGSRCDLAPFQDKELPPMEPLLILFWLVAFSTLVGVFARYRRNRSGIGWAALSFVISPLLTGILVAILPALPAPEKLTGQL